MTTKVMDPGAPLGVGIVGGGFMAEVHSRAARASRGRLIGVVGSSPTRSREIADHLGIEAGVDDLDALLADRGAVHGMADTAGLTAGERADLIAYLETL